jgi:hypothetical protein
MPSDPHNIPLVVIMVDASMSMTTQVPVIENGCNQCFMSLCRGSHNTIFLLRGVQGIAGWCDGVMHVRRIAGISGPGMLA